MAESVEKVLVRKFKTKREVWARCHDPQALRSKSEKEELEAYQGGLFEALGEGLGRWEYVNPHSIGLIQAYSSSIASGHVKDIVAREVGSFMTENIPEEAWIEVDLKGMAAQPERYVLGYFKEASSNAPQTWTFEGLPIGVDRGSLGYDGGDGEPWVVLHEARCDQTFLHRTCGSFECLSTGEWYGHFRIRHRGLTRDGGYCLLASGLELYGSLTGLQKMEVLRPYVAMHTNPGFADKLRLREDGTPLEEPRREWICGTGWEITQRWPEDWGGGHSYQETSEALFSMLRIVDDDGKMNALSTAGNIEDAQERQERRKGLVNVFREGFYAWCYLPSVEKREAWREGDNKMLLAPKEDIVFQLFPVDFPACKWYMQVDCTTKI